MNSISLARFDKKDWIVRTPVYNQYKIFNSKKRRKGQTGPANRGATLFAFDTGEKLSFRFTKWIFNNEKFHVTEQVRYCLRVKNNRLIVYEISLLNPHAGGPKYKVRNASNKIASVRSNLIPSDIEMMRGSSFTTFGNGSVISEGKFRGIFEKRANNILINFLNRKGIKTKKGRDFDENMFYSCFPATEGLKIKQYFTSSVYSRFLFEGDIKTVVKKAFGYDNKKLIKKVVEKIETSGNLNPLVLGVSFKKKLPVDYYYDLLDRSTHNKLDSEYNGLHGMKSHLVFKDLLKRYDKKRIFSLLKQIGEFDNHYLRDALIIYNQRKNDPTLVFPEKPKTWRELHDAINVNHCLAHNPFSTPVFFNKELPVRKYMKEIDGVVEDGFRFEVPKESKVLVDYSTKMNNCIRHYADRVIMESVDLIGVYVGEELKYNISIADKSIEQFYGKYNQKPDPADEQKVIRILEQKKICRTWKNDYLKEYQCQFVEDVQLAPVELELAV